MISRATMNLKAAVIELDVGAASKCPLWVKRRQLQPNGTSALPPKADMCGATRDVRFGPKADILQCGRNWHYSITSSARDSSDCVSERLRGLKIEDSTIFDAKLQAEGA